MGGVLGARERAGAAFFVRGFMIRRGGSRGLVGVGVGGNLSGGVLVLGCNARGRGDDGIGMSSGGYRGWGIGRGHDGKM